MAAAEESRSCVWPWTATPRHTSRPWRILQPSPRRAACRSDDLGEVCQGHVASGIGTHLRLRDLGSGSCPHDAESWRGRQGSPHPSPAGGFNRAVQVGWELGCRLAVDPSYPSSLRRVEVEGGHDRTTPPRPRAQQAGAWNVGCGGGGQVEGRRGPQGGPRGPREVRPSGPGQWWDMPHVLCSTLKASRANFGCFMRSTYKRTVVSEATSAELLPCPIPFAWEYTSSPQGSRRRTRFRKRRALELMVNLQVCALIFSFLCSPLCCPAKGCRGSPRGLQMSLVHSLLERTRSMCRLVGDFPIGSGAKLASVQSELAVFESSFCPLGIWFMVQLSKVLLPQPKAPPLLLYRW